MYKHFVDKFGEGAFIDYAQFIDEALFSQGIGYYRQPRERVGKARDTDFYTAASLGAVFWKMVLAAGAHFSKNKEIFVEIGAEPGGYDYQDELESPFEKALKLRLGDELDIPESAIVFSNELLDAQVFHKMRFIDGVWKEIGLKVGHKALDEVVLPEVNEKLIPHLSCFPNERTEGYTIDFPLGSISLLDGIAKQNWTGTLMFFDYGKSWDELCAVSHEGTARAYCNHCQNNNILKYPGKQDITHHVCWDFLKDVLKDNGFRDITVYTQESFFVKHAGNVIKEIIEEGAGQFSEDKQVLQGLLHPGQMGSKFQILLASR